MILLIWTDAFPVLRSVMTAVVLDVVPTAVAGNEKLVWLIVNWTACGWTALADTNPSSVADGATVSEPVAAVGKPDGLVGLTEPPGPLQPPNCRAERSSVSSASRVECGRPWLRSIAFEVSEAVGTGMISPGD